MAPSQDYDSYGSWPAQIAASEKVRDVQISPDGSLILYQVQPFYKADRALSQLWLAQTAVPNSARPLTRGAFNDRSGVFHPDSQHIIFQSDRPHSGKGTTLFLLSLKANDCNEPQPLPHCPNFGRKGVQVFEISPDGEFIAFTSIDSEDDVQEATRRDPERSDARVMGDAGTQEGFSRLRIYSFFTGQIVTLEGVRRSHHVEAFCWSPDGKWLLYRLQQGRGPEFADKEVILEKISVKNPTAPQYLGVYPRSPSGRNICTLAGRIASLQTYEPKNILDARSLFIHEETSFSTRQVQRLYGAQEDAIRIVDAGMHPFRGRVIAVEVASNVDTHIDVVFLDRPAETPITIFRTKEEAIWFGAWDARIVVDEAGRISYVVAVVLSSGIHHKPPNVWACRVSAGGPIISPRLQLSSHLQWLFDAPVFTADVIEWQSADGTSLNGIIRYPPGHCMSDGPRPTILFLHGGPYRRDIPDYMPYFCNWRELLTVAGYLVISPNYRGSQGRGHEFAHAASRGVGVYDWADCESMVNEVIRRGLADPDRLGIAGWSHGGSLTAWGVTKTKNRFKAAIVGAGVSNWEGMVMDSGSPELETEIGQSAPWDYDGQTTRKASPVHCVAGVTTAVLILHGEKDERVPVGQAIGFWRGLKRRASERAREAAQLVLYPREPHGFIERKHAEDVLKRVLSHFNTWL